MQQDAWRSYLEQALGLTETSRKKAKKVIKALVEQSGASVEQIRSMTEELFETSSANREAIARMVRAELERGLGLVGLATADEVAELNERIADLEKKLRAYRTAAGQQPAEPAEPAGPAQPAAPRKVAKKAVKKTAKKAAAKKTTAKKTTAGGAAKKTTKKAPVRKTTGTAETPAG